MDFLTNVSTSTRIVHFQSFVWIYLGRQYYPGRPLLPKHTRNPLSAGEQ